MKTYLSTAAAAANTTPVGRYPRLARMVCGACFLLLATLAQGASAIDEGRAAYGAGDYDTAIRHWQALIERGRPEGMFFMGVMYAEGKGVERDPARAFALYSQAAEKGFAPAQYNLANQYATGEGVDQDLGKAEHWWTQAAERGLLPAQLNLGNMYYHGATGEKNIALAKKWLTLAAAQGSAEAKQTLAKLDMDDKSAPGPSTEPAVTAAADSATASGIRREAWVLSQPAHHYTIQILAAGTETQARDFIRQQSLTSRVAFIESAAQGAVLFRVFYGSYDNREQADKALAALPKALGANAPWVRSFAEVHKLTDRRHAARGAN